MLQRSAWAVTVARDSDGRSLLRTDSIVAPTGQEEVQYQVLTSPQFGLTDMQVRNWTNGPAFLTWSRGQNSHGPCKPRFELLLLPVVTDGRMICRWQATGSVGRCHGRS